LEARVTRPERPEEIGIVGFGIEGHDRRGTPCRRMIERVKGEKDGKGNRGRGIATVQDGIKFASGR
jgi:hypothetical protein